MYSHGFGTLFLAEAYGMTHRPEIREKLQKAVRLIIDTQNIEGGWRYQPVRRDADLSVTICQINALRAARNAGLFVPKETVDACIRYVKQSQNPDGGFRYMLQGGASAFPRSAAGVVALQSAGEYDSKEVRDGVDYLRQYTREIKLGNRYSHYFYGHYYAAQAMWLRGGDDWAEWYPGDPHRAAPSPVELRASGPTASAMNTARPWRSSSCRSPITICPSFSARVSPPARSDMMAVRSPGSVKSSRIDFAAGLRWHSSWASPLWLEPRRRIKPSRSRVSASRAGAMSPRGRWR